MSKGLSQIHLRDLLSPSIAGDKVMDSGAAGVDPELQRALADRDYVYIYSALDTLAEDALDLVAWGLHVDFYRPDLALANKRELVRGSLEWHIAKGTGPPLKALIEAATTVEPTLQEYPQFLCDWSKLDQDPIVDTPDNFRLDVIMDRDDSAAANVDRDEVQEMAVEMTPERSRQGVQTRFLGFRCDDPDYSQLDVDLLGS